MPATNGHDPSSHAFPPMMGAFPQATAATLKALADHLGQARAVGSGWKCRCPCHDDREPSLELSLGEDGRVLAVCRAGCPKEATWAAVMATGVLPRPERRTARPPKRRGGEVTTYVYRDADGTALFHKLRHPPGHEPRFTLCRPDGSHGIKGVARVPYHLPEVVGAEEVIVAEGEKDCDRLAALGLVATCNFDGASADGRRPKWRAEYDRHFAGKDVIVLADNDDPGRAHADYVARRLLAVARSVRRVDFPELPEKGDVSDWLDGGRTLEDLRALIAATPELTRAAAAAAAEARPAREGWLAELVEDGKKPARVEANVLIALRRAPELAGGVRLNLLANAIELRDMPWCRGSDWHAWTDTDSGNLAAWLQRRGLFVKTATCAIAVVVEAADHKHDPVRDYLLALRWDGRPRLSSWLADRLGAHGAPDAYLEAVGRAWAVAMVARALRPGCKADHVLILEGPQGRLKSSALRSLMPDESWFADDIATLGTKDATQDLRGKWLIELSELSAMGRAEVEKVKAFFSRKVDHYRASYGRFSEDFPRRNGFAGTTNAETYLLDDANRRHWGVKIGRVDLDALVRDRDQLWAEARDAFLAGERWWLDEETEALAAEEQEARRQADPWEDVVRAWLARQADEGRTECTSQQVLEGAIRMPTDRQDRGAQTRVGRAIKAAGWERHRKRDNAGLSWVYRLVPTVFPPGNPQVGTEKPSDINGVPTVPTVPTGNGDDPRARGQAHDTRVAPARMRDGFKNPNPGGNTGTVGTAPPWTDWAWWRHACTLGDERSVLAAWLAKANGVLGKRAARVPKGLPEGDAKRWLLESLLGIGLMIEEF